MIYLVSYDLKNGKPEDYKELYDLFATFSDCKKCLESSWLVVTDMSCEQVRDRLRTKMGPADLIVVVPYGPTRSSWIPKDVINWIHKYMP